jgi:hypothetical protein
MLRMMMIIIIIRIIINKIATAENLYLDSGFMEITNDNSSWIFSISYADRL